jgi:hypothetical protein
MEETKNKVGKFITNTKFLEFVGGKGHVNFITDEAIIEAKYLSGLDLDDVKFKLTICDDNTVDFDEVDSNTTTFEQRQRLLEIIEEKTATSYRNRTVIQELPFTSTKEVKDKFVPLYLAIEYVKPIEKLGSFFDDESDISEDALHNLDSLLNSWFEDEEFAKEVQEMIDEENIEHSNETIMQDHDTNITSMVESSFLKMKGDKLKELKDNKFKKASELNKLEFQLSTIEKNIESIKGDIKLLEDRIDDIQPTEPPNGYYFFVSERQNEKVVLEPEIESIIKDKVSKIKSINVENFMKLFTDGEFHIKLSKKTDDGFELVEDYLNLPEEIIHTLTNLNLGIDENHLIYQGELIWSQIVNKMLKLGFEQNPDFDKKCDSNSYHSKTDKTNITY